MVDDEFQRVRNARRAISAACAHDIDRLFAHYQRYQEELRRSGRFRFAQSPSDSSRTLNLPEVSAASSK